MAFLRLFWEITRILYTAYTSWTVASFWTVAHKFQDADVHWHPLQVHTLGRSDSPYLRGGREIPPSHRILIRAYIYILWTYILWTESAILEFKNAKVLCCIQRTNPTAYTVWKIWKWICCLNIFWNSLKLWFSDFNFIRFSLFKIFGEYLVYLSFTSET